jgi:hypothetical protein
VKISDIVKHKLTKEKVLIIKEYWQWVMSKSNNVRTGFECRLQNYDTKVFYDNELEETKGELEGGESEHQNKD